MCAQCRSVANSITDVSVVTQAEGKAIANRDALYAQGIVIEPPPFDEALYGEDRTDAGS